MQAPAENGRVHCEQAVAWYAVYTRHQHERSVTQILAAKGLETLLPLYPAIRTWKDRTKLISLPLFPCYVFVKAGLDRRLDIVTTPGITALVSNARQLAAIAACEIEDVRRTVESGAHVEPHPFLKCGERVRVKRGPLAGLEGLLVRKKSIFRLVLSIDMLGKSVAVEIDSALIEGLGGARAAAPMPFRPNQQEIKSASLHTQD